MTGGQWAATGGSLEPRGSAAESAAELWWLLLGLGAIPFVVVMVLLVGGLFRRRTPEPEAHTTAGAGQPKRFDRWLIGGGVVMPVVLIVVVLTATVEAMRDVPTSPPDDTLVVDITGHQWWWEVRYPEQQITTANELHLPVGRPVALRLTSADVIHSFWVPQLAGKLDLLPDGVNTLVLRADEPGAYRGECAEFCGLQHARMRLTVIVEPVDRFDEWVATQRQPAAPVGAAAERGAELFLESGCAACHAVRGTAAGATTGPDLTHVASRRVLGGGAADNPEDLAAWVADPHTFKSGVAMPATQLTEDELDDLVAYLGALE